MKKKLLLLLFFISSLCFSQFEKINLAFDPQISQNRLLSNGINDIKISKNVIWISTGKGLSKSIDNGQTWINYFGIPEFIKPGISAFDIKGDTVVCSLIYDSLSESIGKIQIGAGVVFSTDAGKTWYHADQPKDLKTDTSIIYGNNLIPALPVVVDQQNVTWGVSISKNAIWVNSWSSTLRKSTDLCRSFKRVFLPPDSRYSISPNDTLKSDTLNPLKNRNHLGFGVFAVDSNEIWAGTAGGVNRSLDGGLSWVKFNHKSPSSPIIGNWVYRIKSQKYKSRIWITNWKADDQSEETGASYTENKGITWIAPLKGYRVNGFTFRDSIAYFATDDGLIRSDDNFKTFSLFNSIYDPVSKYKISSSNINTVECKNDTIWIGTSDGLAYTIDNPNTKFGSTWKILRAFQSVEKNQSYVYPNPFSPDDEILRFHYGIKSLGSKVTIEIFDFGMNLIRQVISNVSRSGNTDQEEIWDGKDQKGNRTPNGTYFYRIKIDDDISWGKIIVLQ